MPPLGARREGERASGLAQCRAAPRRASRSPTACLFLKGQRQGHLPGALGVFTLVLTAIVYGHVSLALGKNKIPEK